VPRPTLITIEGPMTALSGEPERGSVAFVLRETVYESAGEGMMAPGVIRGTFDADGELSVQVPASNDPDWTPVGWKYRMDLRLSGGLTTYEVVIPYDAPGGVLKLRDLLPAAEGGQTLYAAYSHTHDGYLSADELAAALAEYPDNDELTTALDDYLPLAGGTLSGNLVVQDAGADKSYGLRVDGSGLDFNGAGADLYIGVFEGAGNTGPQRNYLRLEKGVALAHAIGRWIFVTNADTGDAAIDIDPGANKVTVDAILEVGTAGLIRFGAAADANLYRVGPDYLATDGKIAAALDIECWTSGRGLVLHDRTNDTAYRLKVTSGVLGIEPV
jgi:hypothetical protein